MQLITFFKKTFIKIAFFCLHLFLLLCFLTGALALHYSERPSGFRSLLAVIFFAIAMASWWAFFKRRRLSGLILSLLLLSGISLYWSTIAPSNDRIWRDDHALVPYAEFLDDDTVRIGNFRNFDYQSLDDYTIRYKDRVVKLSHLISVDFFVSYWGIGPLDHSPVAHTFVSFNFDNAPPVSISIEARFEEHENYDPLASMFKQFELIYVVGSEEDIVKVRTNIRHEDVFRYPVNISADASRRLFLVYLGRINELYEKPEFYHLLSNNCTINVFRYANKIGRTGGLDIRLILNGYSDRYLYRSGSLDTQSHSFREFRALAHLNDLTQNAPEDTDFSALIRSRLP